MAVPSSQNQRNVYQVAEDYRAQLLRREQAAVDDITRRYLVARHQIEQELDALVKRTEAAIKAGRVPVILNYGENFGPDEFSGSWLYRIGRLEQLERTILAEIGRLGEDTLEAVQRRVRVELENGTVEARSLLAFRVRADGLVVPSQFAQLPTGALEQLTAFVSEGGPIPKAFRQMGPELVQQMQQRLVTGLAKGENPRVIGARMKRDSADGGILDRPLYEQVRVARTEPLRAYRESARITYKANADVVAAWEWRAFPGPRTCAYCLAMDGTKHDLDEKMATHPQCRCTELPVTELSEDPPVSGAEYLYNLDANGQDNVFGSRTMGELYRSGKIQLTDVVEQYDHPEWGRVGRAASMRSMEQRGIITRDDIVQAKAQATKRPSWPFVQPKDFTPKSVQLPLPGTNRTEGAPSEKIEWQASMPGDMAARWASGSVIKEVQKHVTRSSAVSAIESEGFSLGHKWARVWGDGVYMTENPKVLDFYKSVKSFQGTQEVLDLRVNVGKILEVRPPDGASWNAWRYTVDALPEKVRKDFNISREVIEMEAKAMLRNFHKIIDDAQKNGKSIEQAFIEEYGTADIMNKELEWYILQQRLRAAGYDGIRVVDPDRLNVSPGIGGDQLVIFEPQNVTVIKR